MKNNRLKEFLIHPAFAAFVLTVIVILLIPQIFLKYRIKHIEDEYTHDNNWHAYYDLDSDGNSEKISFDLNDREQTKIIVSTNNRVLNQYNLKYKTAISDPGITYIDDINNDGFSEIFVHTMSVDSIFLNIIDPLKEGKIILENRFIEKRNKASTSSDAPYFVPVGTIESDSGTKDFIFFINSGYSLQPRNVYRYCFIGDSLLKSPPSGAAIQKCQIIDINNDSRPEILLDVAATGNLGKDFPFTDRFSWLMVLDENMKFLFPPVQLCDNPSRVSILPLRHNNSTFLLAFNDYFGAENIKSAFYLYDIRGNRIGEDTIKGYEVIGSKILPKDKDEAETFFFIRNTRADVDEIDFSLNVLKNITIPGIDTYGGIIYDLDADLDGNNEHIFKGKDMHSLVFVQRDFSNPVSWHYIMNRNQNPKISHVLNKGSKPMLYLQYTDHGTYISYEKNKLFILRYPFYLLIYLGILAFISSISRIQQYRLVQKQLAEKKMASLQMKAIKNQIDPHFTLNVLNAIGSLYATEKNRDKADYIFGKYARLIRQTVVSSDKVIATLGEEIDFVRNYIELEQFRSDYSFNYSIDIGDNVDRQMRIPRMLIHTFVENAIKYGVRNRTQGSFLKIVVDKTMKKCRITVEDNGPGLNRNEKSSSGTGKGLTILDELIDLYFRLEKLKITYSIQNIYKEAGKVIGTRALIEIDS